ncbi:L-arabinolactonase [Tsuneonella dongtanensis]|uniref:L-arabinolactonase n=1 Tax=Tsuneonella dongtanensis TaxID=692370 RepID=A0A1B2A901_9SPHN|nr:SMP-30/gluconolactonase/LRE family protein [Tsuneonella dongtanensis]ANY18639.1 L-arabinolactonase [Tsuneonella dongtanensis]
MSVKLECLWPVASTLGEGPRWSTNEQSLYFVDIKKPCLHRIHPETGKTQSWVMPDEIGFVGFSENSEMLGGFSDGIYRIGRNGIRGERIACPEPDLPGNRLNDGIVDADGNLWFGSMDNSEKAETGALYRLSPDGKLVTVDRGYCITNGPAFSPDGKTLYHTDTLRRVIYRFDIEETNVFNRKVFARIDEEEGCPDGLTVDADGCIWSGLWGGWGLLRFAPDGGLITKLEVPTANVTACTFGGRNLDTLFITTARKGLSDIDLLRQPLAGGLFVCDPGVKGLPQHLFA